MSLPFFFHPQAELELHEAVDYLESERPGTGLALAKAVEEAIEFICDMPLTCPAVRGDIRLKLVLPTHRWHYTIYYRAKPDHVRILAVAHQKRLPFYWIRRE